MTLLDDCVPTVEAVLAQTIPQSDICESIDLREDYLKRLESTLNVTFDRNSEFALCGSYMLLASCAYSLLAHEADGAHDDQWYQTTSYTGVARLGMKALENEDRGDAALAEGLRIISDPTRFQILRVLSEKSVYAKELCDELELSPSTVSKHITKLINAGLVDCRIDSVRTYYSLNRENAYVLLHGANSALLGEWDPSRRG